MYGTEDGPMDAPRYLPVGIPIPITHSDFKFEQRRIDTSRNRGSNIDTTMAEAAGRRIAEMVEKTAIGIVTGMSYGAGSQYASTPTIYGMKNHPDRATKTDITDPSSGTSWTPNTLYNEVLTMIDLLNQDNYMGPFVLYYSTDWGPYMNRVFSTEGGNHPGETTRTMLMKIEEIKDVRKIGLATPTNLSSTFNLWLVQMTSDVARAVIGMDVRTVQWPSKGGLEQNFKVMCMYVPQYRSTYSGRMGLCHGTIS